MHLTTVCQHARRKLIDLQGETNESIVVVGDINTYLSAMDRSSRPKISEDIVKLSNTVNQLDVMDIYRLLHPTTAESTFISSSHSQNRPRTGP